MVVINGIAMILIGLASAIYLPSICERHHEKDLAVSISFGGIAVAGIGAANVLSGLNNTKPDMAIDDMAPVPTLSPTVIQIPVVDTVIPWVPVTVECWTRHDLGFVADTVTALSRPHKSGSQWYFKSDDPSGESWSDRHPKTITRDTLQ